MGRIANKILHAFKAEDRPLSPLETAKIIKEDRGSVRTEIRRMYLKGMIDKAYYGHYCSKPTYEVGTPPRVQNLLFVATCRKNPVLKGRVNFHKEIVYEFREKPNIPELDFRVRLEFGTKRDKIHWTVKAPLGLDLYGLLLARQWAESKVESYNRDFKDLIWDCKRVEFLKDYQRVTLEGISIITIDDLCGTLEKYYQKSYGVRKEFRISPEGQRFEDIVALTSGGVVTQQVVQGVFMVSKKIEDLTKAFGSTLQRKEKSDEAMIAISESQFRVLDILDKMDARLKRLEKDG